MGYSQTTIAIFGVELTNEQAELIFNKHFHGGEELQYDEVDTLTNELSYVRHGKNVYRERHMPQMLADGADSRIDNMSYSEDSGRHVLGIYLASKGYAYGDKIEDYLIPSDKAISNFNKYIQPILDEDGIILTPRLQIISQVW